MCIAHNTDHPFLCCVFHLTLSLPVTHCSGHNSYLPSNTNISKTVTVNIVFTERFQRVFDKLSHVIQDDIQTLQLWFSSYWYSKFVELQESQKLSFSVFPELKRLKRLTSLENRILVKKGLKAALREKCPDTEFFLVCVFPHSDWIRRDTSYSVRMRENIDQENSVFGHFLRSAESCSSEMTWKLKIWVEFGRNFVFAAVL